MGLFDGVGGVYGGAMPLGTMMPMGVATSMGAAASAVGVPGFSMAPSAFPLIAGMGWSSRSSYFGQPEFRGVADMATHSNDLQRGWSPGFALGGGLGAFGMGVPAVGSGGYYIGPYPSFNPMEMFSWMYQQTFGAPQQQPAGPAQAAAPQPAPAQVDAKEGEKKEEPKKAAPRRARPRPRPAATTPAGAPPPTPAEPGVLGRLWNGARSLFGF